MGSELPQITPLLDLDESHYPRSRRRSPYPKIDGFAASAQKTFRMYKESNQRIHTFRLCLKSEWYGLSGLAAKWTSKALKMGATDLTFRLHKTYNDYPPIFIPFDEVFRTERVLALRLDTLKVFQRLQVIKCTRLTSLTLTDVSLSADSFFNIVSSYPLIENLSLSNIDSFDEKGCERVARLPEGSAISLHRLTSLVLSRVREGEIQNLFLGDSSSKFPNLKELTLCLCILEICFISIHSLEILNFSVYLSCGSYTSEQYESRRVEFDVPSIRKFAFEGRCIPNLSFRSTSMDQCEESRVQLTRNGELRAPWYGELSDFLKELKRSKIHLCLHLHYKESNDYNAGEIEGLDLRELEDLTMDTKSLPCVSFNSFLDGLFRICRPKMITQYASPRNSNDAFLCRALIGQGMQGKMLMIISQFMLSLLDLEEVNAQKLFSEEWIPQPLDSILDDSQSRFRFQLKWKPC